MPDYKVLYHTLLHATEDALNLLIAAQRECEERYLAAEDETTEKSADGTE